MIQPGLRDSAARGGCAISVLSDRNLPQQDSSDSLGDHRGDSDVEGYAMNVMHEDIDFLDAAAWEDHDSVREQMRWLRENEPVYWSPKTNAWIITKFDDVVHISKQNRTFCSGEGTRPRNPVKLALIDEDEPRHTRLRRLINRGFTPRRVMRLEAIFQEITRETLDKVAGKGECDFVDDIAVPLPLMLIAEMIGIRREDRELFHQWSDAMIGGAGNFDVPEIVQKATQAFMEYSAYVTEVIDDRRKDPREDLVSILIGARDEGILNMPEREFSAFDDAKGSTTLPNDELVMMMVLLLVAGNETTRNGISGGMQLLIENPEQRKRLIEVPSLIPAAVEEMLRLTSPVLAFARTANQDTEVRGRAIRKGQRVLMLYPSANRDADIFENPDVFDIERHPHHLAFGIGNHFCLGANLARMEMRVAFSQILLRLPDMEYAAGGPELGSSSLVRNVRHMFVRYTAEI